MRGFVGIGKSSSVEQAVEEATSGLKKADLLILTAPYNVAEKAASLISAKYPGIPLIGATGPSIAKGTIYNSSIVLTAFAGVTVETGILKNVTKTPVSSIDALDKAAESIEVGDENTICICFSTRNEGKTVSTLNTVLNRYNIPLAGGTTYGNPLGANPVVIYNGNLYDRSCVYALIKNNVGHIRVYKENIYERMSKTAHIATLVDSNTNALFQLDNEVAFETYKAEVGCEREEVVQMMPFHPLGRALGTETIITSTVSLDLNGVMFNGKALYDNDSIYIMKLGNVKKIHSNFIENIKENNNISFVYSFESLNRLKVFENEGMTDTYLSSLSYLGAHSTLLGEGEQCNNQHMNQTLVCAVFE